jgi:hypothetical protein
MRQQRVNRKFKFLENQELELTPFSYLLTKQYTDMHYRIAFS